MDVGGRAGAARFGACVVALFALGSLFLGLSSAQAAPTAPRQQDTPPAGISITQTPSGSTLPFCLPAFLALRHSVGGDAQTFRLRIEVTAPLCSRLDAVAVIYSMPGNGVAWPQTFVTSRGFSLREPGVTEIVFTRGCEPVQFDVVVGDTPSTISPDGIWHGPLLFPLDLSTSQQWWGCGPTPTTTTSSTTTSVPPTTVLDNCEDYTPTSISASPSVVAPGQVVAVAGTGTPGTTVRAVLRSGSGTVAALSNTAVVAPDGSWSTSLTVPGDAAPGGWSIAAYAADCDTEVSTDVTVEEDSGGPTTTPSTEPPVVAGETVVNELPPQAVVLGSAEGRAAGNGGGAAAGLAFTGAGARLPVMIAVTMIAAGGLLLLRQRQST